jgi:hypothetical protein
MNAMFPDKEHLVTPINPVHTDINESEILKLIELPKSNDPIEKQKEFKAALNILQKFVRERGEKIPPLINNYMQLSPSMKSFGTALNPDFGGVEETGILIKIADIYEEKKARHLDFIKD